MAGFIPEDIVEKIKTDTDILDLIMEYVNLKKAGKDYIGLCPFHREKTPSFTVVQAKDFYYCFGCGASGNAVNFIMRHENLDYPEALRFLAKRARISIPEKGSADSLTGKLYQAIEYARSFYIKTLKDSKAYEYLKSRNINDETIKELGLGYAPPGWDNLLQALSEDKLSPEIFEKAGLLMKSDKRAGYYDKFRNRLMFPICNISSRPIGFGGRVLSDDEGPKYLNSPETQIYHKGSVLYGLNWSKNHIRQARKAVITEGYFDYITLFQAGIKNIVAVSGTGFTNNQASLLARFCNEVVLLYDADSAGMKATFRAVDVLYNSNLEPLIASLPKGSDPDSFIKCNGCEELIGLINAARGYLEFVRDSLPDRFIQLPLSRQENIISSLVETAGGIEDELKHDLFVRKAIETFDLPSTVISKFQKRSKRIKNEVTSGLTGRKKFEMTFLGLLVSHPEFIRDSLKTIKADNFSDHLNREIYEKLNFVEVDNFSVGNFLEQIPENGERRELIKIVVNEISGASPDILFSDYINKFKQFQNSDKLASIRAEIARAEKEGDVQKTEHLYREYRDLQNEANRKVV